MLRAYGRGLPDSVTYVAPGTNGTPEVAVSETETVAITSDGTPVTIATVHQVNNFSTANIVAPGHIVGAFNYAFNASGAGNTNALAVGSENSIGNNNGTITRANSSLNTINGNAAGKTITLWTGATSVPTNNAGTITSAQGFRAEVTSGNTGTISSWAGFYNEDVSAIPGITVRYAFVNNDAGAVFKSKAPFCDNSFVALSPTNGGTTNIPAGVGLVVLNSGGNIAGCTLAFAAEATFTDGQKITFYSVFAITTPAYTSAGVTQLGFPSTIAAGAFFTVQYAAVGPYWIRVG